MDLNKNITPREIAEKTQSITTPSGGVLVCVYDEENAIFQVDGASGEYEPYEAAFILALMHNAYLTGLRRGRNS